MKTASKIAECFICTWIFYAPLSIFCSIGLHVIRFQTNAKINIHSTSQTNTFYTHLVLNEACKFKRLINEMIGLQHTCIVS